MPILSAREREVVAVGAAIGAGCRPCTNYHVRAGLKAGLTEDEIRLAVDEAEVLRIHAATSIADLARGLLGSSEERAAPLCSPTEPLQALAQVGAATGSNAGHALDRLLPYARGLGLSGEALSEAVEMAGVVKRMAAEFFGKDAERALGGEATVVPAPEGGSCAEAAQPCAGAPDAREPAASATTSCC